MKTMGKQPDFSIAEKWNGITAIVGCVAPSLVTLSLGKSFPYGLMEILIVLAAVAASTFEAYQDDTKNLNITNNYVFITESKIWVTYQQLDLYNALLGNPMVFLTP